jgi:lipoprotein-anchoring transpeptidase ErfK/SrfK
LQYTIRRPTPVFAGGGPVSGFTDAQLGQPLSSGCVRESQLMAKVVYDWTPVGTTVVVTP